MFSFSFISCFILLSFFSDLSIGLVVLEFVVLVAMFAGEYTTTLAYACSVIFFVGLIVSEGLDSLYSAELYRRLVNEAVAKKLQGGVNIPFIPVNDSALADQADGSLM
jgi:hypothetical protein